MACLGPFGPSLFYSVQLLCVVGIFVISLVQNKKLRPRVASELAQVALGAEESGSEVGFFVIFNGVLSTLPNTKHSPLVPSVSRACSCTICPLNTIHQDQRKMETGSIVLGTEQQIQQDTRQPTKREGSTHRAPAHLHENGLGQWLSDIFRMTSDWHFVYSFLFKWPMLAELPVY